MSLNKFLKKITSTFGAIHLILAYIIFGAVILIWVEFLN